MAGYKRGGSRGAASFKKGFTKKRAGSDDEESAPRASKKAKGDEEDDSTPFVPELKTDSENQQYVGLNASGKRRVIVREFKSNILIDIREFYGDDSGDLKPGKKGISLNLDQYNALVSSLPLIEAALVKKEVQPARPDYEADLGAAKTSKTADTEGDEEEEATERAGVDDEEEEED